MAAILSAQQGRPTVTPSGIPIPAAFFDYAAHWMVLIDREAVAAGQQFRQQCPDASELRARAAEYERKGLSWLAAINRQNAELLELPDVRLTGAGLLYQAAHSDGTRQHFIAEYRDMLTAHLAAQPSAEAAE
jgi:hypothetical protein